MTDKLFFLSPNTDRGQKFLFSYRPIPIKYGYINVGKIINGPKNLINKNIFTLFPHQTIYEIPIKNVNLLPKKNLRKYVLVANMETAKHILGLLFK